MTLSFEIYFRSTSQSIFSSQYKLLFQNYAATLKENVVLKTRLKRSNNEIAKKDRQLQNLMFSEVCCSLP